MQRSIQASEGYASNFNSRFSAELISNIYSSFQNQ